MKIKLTLPAGWLSSPRQLVINAMNIDSMMENDDGGTDIQMTDGKRYAVKETVAEIIAAYTPAPESTPKPKADDHPKES